MAEEGSSCPNCTDGVLELVKDDSSELGYYLFCMNCGQIIEEMETEVS